MCKEIIMGLRELSEAIRQGVPISDSEPLTDRYAKLCSEAAEALARLSKESL